MKCLDKVQIENRQPECKSETGGSFCLLEKPKANATANAKSKLQIANTKMQIVKY